MGIQSSPSPNGLIGSRAALLAADPENASYSFRKCEAILKDEKCSGWKMNVNDIFYYVNFPLIAEHCYHSSIFESEWSNKRDKI